MKKKTIALFVLLFAAFLALQTGTSAAESHIEAENGDEVMVELTSSEFTDEERAALIKEIAAQIVLLQQAVEDLQILVALVIEAQGAILVEAPTPTPTVPTEQVVSVPITPVAVEEVEVIDLGETALAQEEDIFASIQESEEEVDVDALFAAVDIDQGGQGEGGSRLLGTFGDPENRGAFVLIAAFIVGGILFALSRRKKGPKPVTQTTEQKVEPQPTAPTFDQAPWG